MGPLIVEMTWNTTMISRLNGKIKIINSYQSDLAAWVRPALTRVACWLWDILKTMEPGEILLPSDDGQAYLPRIDKQLEDWNLRKI
jgi:hypothetical protein